MYYLCVCILIYFIDTCNIYMYILHYRILLKHQYFTMLYDDLR